MTVDIGEVESFLGIPTPKLNVHSMTPILLPEGIKDRFKSLKMDFLERGHEAEFYNLISSFVPQFKSLLDLKDMEKQVMTQKSNLKSQKESISDIKLQCEAIISEICLNLNEIETNKKQMINTIGNIRDLESELNYINTFHYADQDLIQQLQMEKTKEELEIQQIEMELNQLQNEIDDDNSRIEELMMEEEKLVVVSTNAELDAMKALKISEERDPQIEELARWFKESTLLLKQMNYIENFNVIDESKFEFEYCFIPSKTITVTFNLNHVTEMFNNNLIDVEFSEDVIMIDDLLETVKTLGHINTMLTFLIQQICLRLDCHFKRENEFNQLIELGGSLTVETGELLLHPENSNRVFVFKVFPTYPLGGLQSVRVIGIEPMMFDEEVDVWNDKLDKMSITSILELLPSLN